MQLLLLLFRAVMSKTTLLLQLMHVGINSVCDELTHTTAICSAPVEQFSGVAASASAV
jgi:hypothetical protein